MVCKRRDAVSLGNMRRRRRPKRRLLDRSCCAGVAVLPQILRVTPHSQSRRRDCRLDCACGQDMQRSHRSPCPCVHGSTVHSTRLLSRQSAQSSNDGRVVAARLLEYVRPATDLLPIAGIDVIARGRDIVTAMRRYSCPCLLHAIILTLAVCRVQQCCYWMVRGHLV